MKRRLRFLALVAVLAALGCGTVARQIAFRHPKVASMLDTPVPDRQVTHPGRVETIGDGEDRITVLHVSGSPYEMGYEHGRLLREQVQLTVQDVTIGLRRFLPRTVRNTWLLTTGDKDRIMAGILDRAWAQMSPFVPPADLEELRGLADGSGVPLVVLQRLHAIPDFSETSCSGLVARDQATRDGHVYQLRILDYGNQFGLEKRPLLIVYRPADSYAFVNVGWIGFIGVVSGMNEKSVALSEMGYGDPTGESLHGMPMPFLLKNVLRYADSAAAGAALVRAAPRNNSYVYFLGDRTGGAIGLITSREHCQTYRVNEQEVIEMDGRVYPQMTDVVYAGHDQQKQAALVRDHWGKFDLATLQQLSRQIAAKSNLHTVIHDLTDDILWVANREGKTRAADRPYVEFSLRDQWGRSALTAESPAR